MSVLSGGKQKGHFSFERKQLNQQRWMPIGHDRMLSREEGMLVEYDVPSRAAIGAVFLSVGMLLILQAPSLQLKQAAAPAASSGRAEHAATAPLWSTAELCSAMIGNQNKVHLWCIAGDNERVALIDSQGHCIALKGPDDPAGAAAVAVERQNRNGDTIMYSSVPGHITPETSAAKAIHGHSKVNPHTHAC